MSWSKAIVEAFSFLLVFSGVIGFAAGLTYMVSGLY